MNIDWGFLEAPAPVWLVVAAFLILLASRGGDNKDTLEEISGNIDALRRHFCPTEAERMEEAGEYWPPEKVKKVWKGER